MNQWYVVHTRPHAEEKARVNLERQGFGVYLPRYSRRRSHARRVDRVLAPLFPRYLFVALDVTKARWRSILSTVGVSQLVCRGDRPAPVAGDIIDDIRGREGDDGLVRVDPGPSFHRGEAVRIVKGPLNDQFGLFECASDDERVVVLLTLLGRELRVEMPEAAVRAAA